MLIEAVDHPIRYRFPGGEIRLEPGRPVEVEPERAAKLLVRAGAKVREVSREWNPTWRELAELTTGLRTDSPRLPVVMAALNACDDAYLNGDWEAFRHAAAQVRSAVAERTRRAEP